MIARNEIYSSRSILLTDKENVDAALNVFFKSIGFSGATARGKAEVEDFVEHLSHDVPLIKETLKHQEKTLFQTTKQNISLHINNIFKEGKLDRECNSQGMLDSSTEGERSIRRKMKYYDLDVIISVGYRVNFM